jgi:isocitrate dehydrogenase
MSSDPTIIYTLTDEAPLLATHAFLPVVSAFAKPAGIRIEASDISVAARILGNFPEFLTPEQRVPDALAELGKKTLEPDANIVKLPNISASMPQLLAAITDLQEKAESCQTTPEPGTRRRKIHQGALQQVHRLCGQPGAAQGTRSPRATCGEEYARKNPHSMGSGRRRARTCAHARRRFLPRRKIGHAGPCPRRQDGAGHQ